jgi:hypothetical protein
MTHSTEHVWESDDEGKAPYLKVRVQPEANVEGFKLVLAISNVEKGSTYSMSMIHLNLDTWAMERFGMELIRIAAAARSELAVK